MKFFMLISLIFSLSFGEEILTEKQREVLMTVRNVAKMVPSVEGKTYQDALTAICLSESSAGRDLVGDVKPGMAEHKGSLGIMQMKVSTAREVARNHKKLKFITLWTDRQLATQLKHNQQFAALMATYYFIGNLNHHGTVFKAISRYNGGLNNWKYVQKVNNNLRLVKLLKARGEIS